MDGDPFLGIQCVRLSHGERGFEDFVESGRQSRPVTGEARGRIPVVQRRGQRTVVQGDDVSEEGAPGQIEVVSSLVGTHQFSVEEYVSSLERDGEFPLILKAQPEGGLTLGNGDLV